MRYAIPAIFLTLTLAFLVDARRGVSLPIPEPVWVEHADLHLGPPRSVLRDPPTIQNGQYRQTCQECHGLFDSQAEPRFPPLQHTHVALNHGMNDSCYSCHSIENRNKLVLRAGKHIGYDDVEQLCAQCHGTVFRDWQAGTHGRTTGFWDREAGEAKRLVCTECHNPHSPAFPSLVPLPGPNTMRMGPRRQHGGSEEQNENPLERWKAALPQEDEEH